MLKMLLKDVKQSSKVKCSKVSVVVQKFYVSQMTKDRTHKRSLGPESWTLRVLTKVPVKPMGIADGPRPLAVVAALLESRTRSLREDSKPAFGHD